MDSPRERAMESARACAMESARAPATDLPQAIALEGISNLRDLGGWPVAGGRVRRGRIFRAAALAGMTAADTDVLTGLGLRTICDLRGREESAGAPSPLAALGGSACTRCRSNRASAPACATSWPPATPPGPTRTR